MAALRLWIRIEQLFLTKWQILVVLKKHVYARRATAIDMLMSNSFDLALLSISLYMVSELVTSVQ